MRARHSGGQPFPSRFRRRLTVAFVLVAAIASGLLALGCLTFVRTSRIALFQERSFQQARLAMALAGGQSAVPLQGLVSVARTEPGFEVVAVSGSQSVSSLPGLTVRSVPTSVRGSDAGSGIRSTDTTVAGIPYLVLAGGLPDGQRLYLFFSEASVFQTLHDLSAILIGGWLIVVALAAAVGYWIARRTLVPVRSAAEAARRLAGGLLDTRLQERANDEFGTWAMCFNEMAAGLQATIASLAEARDREARFTSDVAHELRTPLSAILGAAELVIASRSELPPDVRRPAELVLESAERLRLLVADLLELCRMEAAVDAVQKEPVALDEAVRAVVRQSGWEGVVAVDVEPVLVDTDLRRLERILANLLSNAVRHGQHGVGVRTSDEGDEVTIDVYDHGPGIAPEDLPRIFDRFFKADRSRSSGGTGLGLAIAQQHARMLGTEIEVCTEPGAGASFRFRLARAHMPGIGLEAADHPVAVTQTAV